MTENASASNPAMKACARLAPLVAILVASGNRVIRPFADERGGYACLMADPIDFDALESMTTAPDGVAFSREHDLISEGRAMCKISGPRHWLPSIASSAKFYAAEAVAAADRRPIVLERDPLSPRGITTLELILGHLLNEGNELVYYDWRWGDGTVARVLDPIAYERVRSAFVLPDWIVLDEAHDLIRDTMHGFRLEGPDVR